MWRGTPRISAITTTGSWAAYASTISTRSRPLAAMSSSSSSAVSRALSSSPLIAFAVKARDTSLR